MSAESMRVKYAPKTLVVMITPNSSDVSEWLTVAAAHVTASSGPDFAVTYDLKGRGSRSYAEVAEKAVMGFDELCAFAKELHQLTEVEDTAQFQLIADLLNVPRRLENHVLRRIEEYPTKEGENEDALV